MKKARMNISHSRFILSKLKIFGEIVTIYRKTSTDANNIFEKQPHIFSFLTRVFHWVIFFPYKNTTSEKSGSGSTASLTS